jgi:hypothetical protein
MLHRRKGREIKDAGAHNSVIGYIYRVVLVNTPLKFDENTELGRVMTAGGNASHLCYHQ